MGTMSWPLDKNRAYALRRRLLGARVEASGPGTIVVKAILVALLIALAVLALKSTPRRFEAARETGGAAAARSHP